MNKRNKPGRPQGVRQRQFPGQRPIAANTQASVDIFNDRRREADRREQSLPIPARMCRRKNDRRKNSFNSRPWWLQVNYNDDLKHWI